MNVQFVLKMWKQKIPKTICELFNEFFLNEFFIGTILYQNYNIDVSMSERYNTKKVVSLFNEKVAGLYNIKKGKFV